jgi:HEAT repeat protein
VAQELNQLQVEGRALLKDSPAARASRMMKESASAHDERRARLLNEIGELHESIGDHEAARLSYQGADEASVTFAAPVEGLRRLWEQFSGLPALPELAARLAERATTPDERVRARVLAALGSMDTEPDRAIEWAREAIQEVDASPAERAQALLCLEVLAGGEDATQNTVLRLEALRN